MPVIRLVRVRAVSFLTLSLVIAILGAAPVATAVPGGPTGLSPSATSVSDVPVLEWNRVPGAVDYEVQLSTSPGYATLTWQAITHNRRSSPNVQLPAGTLHWRVRARDASGAGPWSEASFTRSALAAPAPLGPADGAELQPPTQPALLSWTPRRGATGYTIEVSTDPQFIDAGKVRSYYTQTASYVVPDPVVATDYHWRVRAEMGPGIATQWSAVRDYRMAGLARPVLTSPSDSPTSSVVDVVLDWEPVVGATSYNVQISTDRNFNSIDHERYGVLATSYSPAYTLNNDQYYWRVSPVDVAGNTLDWDQVDVWQFRRHWPDQTELLYPADDAMVGDPFYYQWTPVEHADGYRIELATNRDFTDVSRYDSCTTVHTTYTPSGAYDCFPLALGTYYWRVVPVDAPTGVQGDAINAEVHRFTYDPSLVQQLEPAPGASDVSLPTFRWEPVAGAATYDLEFTNTATNQSSYVSTTGTSWTPRYRLEPGQEYRWRVRTVSPTGRQGAWLLPESQPRFTVGTPATGSAALPQQTTPNGLVAERFPTLAWTPVAGAVEYAVQIRSQGTIPWSTLPERFRYAAGEDAGSTWLVPDTYQWRVEAYDQNGSSLGLSSSPRTFVIPRTSAVTGQRLALTGIASGSSDQSCAKAITPGLPPADQQCNGLRGTPVLRWDEEKNTAQYRVVLSRDQQLTNVLTTYTTEQTMFIPPSALYDSQAGSAFFWHVQPCRSPGNCRPLEHAGHAFNKISRPVELLAPVQDGTAANAVTFTWRDYLATNLAAPLDAGGSGSVPADVEAHLYRLQVDDDPNFQSLLDSALVDQTTYTAPVTTYPEGPVYWRVQALDGTGNPLSWSATGRFTKRSPAVALADPTGNAATSGVTPLRWQPLAYAATYDVEVYKNTDTIGQVANLVFSGNSRQAAISPTVPLPVSDQSYTWRVRPRDAYGRPGPWTDLSAPTSRFRVTGQAPTPTSPSAGSQQSSNDLLFSWTPVDGAADYRYELRSVGNTALTDAVRTPGLAWAPSVVGDGAWEWRVVALDSVGAPLGSSAWSRFTVDQTQPVVVAVKPAAATVKRTATFTLTFSEPVTGATRKTVTISPYGSRKKLSAVVKMAGGGTKATLNPAGRLKKGRAYSIKVTGKVQDSAGNSLLPYERVVTAK